MQEKGERWRKDEMEKRAKGVLKKKKNGGMKNETRKMAELKN